MSIQRKAYSQLPQWNNTIAVNPVGGNERTRGWYPDCRGWQSAPAESEEREQEDASQDCVYDS